MIMDLQEALKPEWTFNKGVEEMLVILTKPASAEEGDILRQEPLQPLLLTKSPRLPTDEDHAGQLEALC